MLCWLFVRSLCVTNPFQLYYQRGVVFDPTNANCVGNFASFCFRVNNDVERANELFTQALKQQPDHVNNLCKYATFLTKTTANARVRFVCSAEYFCSLLFCNAACDVPISGPFDVRA